jgi:hypothetical protein
MSKKTPTEEGQDRRKFLRQSAEVAAASLFAGTALETVIERVVRRVGETDAMRRLASDVAGNLRGYRLESQALADCY